MTGSLAHAIAIAALAAGALQASDAALRIADRVTRLTRASEWTRVSAIPVRFRTYHPQGMVKIGETMFVSSVEVIDREAGRGVGHLFKFDLSGQLIADLKLGEGAMYHPGGLDYDGRYIWVAVAEYRPDSRSIVYRVDPSAMTAHEVFRFGDHLGAIVHDTDDGTLHGVSWGSRYFYRWPIGSAGTILNPDARPETQRTPNPSHYVDYQDCKYAGRHRMLCTGVTEIRQAPDAPPFRLGGIELVDLAAHRPLHQVPLLLWTRGLDMSHNPVWIEPTAGGLRGYFMPEDDESILYVFDVTTER